jgi:hypothetical protein
MKLLRESASELSIDNITAEIAALQRMVDYYNDYIERKGKYDYVEERLSFLYSRMAEFMIARELHIEKV